MEILILALIIVALVLLLRVIKIPKVGNMILITGGIKTGKSTLSVHMVNRLYTRQLIKFYIKGFLLRVVKFLKIKKFKNVPLPEKPLIYSNIPLKRDYVPLTNDLLLRKTRFVYGSVVYVCESSLFCDSQSFKNDEVNERMLLLNKLFAHETKGGFLVYDTQSISDNHYAVKRTLSTYLHIHHTIKIPFFCLMWLQELHYSEDGSRINTFDDDAENKLQLIIVPKSVWKQFDCYCYSVLTDKLKVDNNVVKKSKVKSLKAKKIISVKKFKTIETEVNENEI